MNKVILMGRLTRDPEVRYSAGDNSLAIARYTLAVDRRFKRDGVQPLILSAVWHSAEQQSSLKNISVRVSRSQSVEESRPEATPPWKARRSIPQR